ncbi:uncharacterized protein LOC144120039 [Amblyomma americanum]
MAHRSAPLRRLLESLRLKPKPGPVRVRSKEVEINRVIATPDVAARVIGIPRAESREQPSPRPSLASDQDLLHRGTPSDTGSRAPTTAVESGEEKGAETWDLQWRVVLMGLCVIACTLFATVAYYAFGGGTVSTDATIEVGGGRPENRSDEPTKACQLQSQWLVSIMEKQVDPCWETNAFVCDGSQLPLKGSPPKVVAE